MFSSTLFIGPERNIYGHMYLVKLKSKSLLHHILFIKVPNHDFNIGCHQIDMSIAVVKLNSDQVCINSWYQTGTYTVTSCI